MSLVQTQLKYLKVHSEEFHSNVLSCMENRRISDNNFSGKIPEFIGKWKRIEKL